MNGRSKEQKILFSGDIIKICVITGVLWLAISIVLSMVQGISQELIFAKGAGALSVGLFCLTAYNLIQILRNEHKFTREAIFMTMLCITYLALLILSVIML